MNSPLRPQQAIGPGSLKAQGHILDSRLLGRPAGPAPSILNPWSRPSALYILSKHLCPILALGPPRRQGGC